MKKAVLSILVTLIGFFFMYKCNILLQEFYLNEVSEVSVDTFFSSDFNSFKKLYIIIIICISLVSFYLGLISVLKKNSLGNIGIVLSIILCIFAFIPFYNL